MIASRVQSASHSSIECVVSTIAVPPPPPEPPLEPPLEPPDAPPSRSGRRAAIAEMTFHIARRARGSMPVDGSSRNTTAGAPSVAIATESLRCCGRGTHARR